MLRRRNRAAMILALLLVTGQSTKAEAAGRSKRAEFVGMLALGQTPAVAANAVTARAAAAAAAQTSRYERALARQAAVLQKTVAWQQVRVVRMMERLFSQAAALAAHPAQYQAMVAQITAQTNLMNRQIQQLATLNTAYATVAPAQAQANLQWSQNRSLITTPIVATTQQIERSVATPSAPATAFVGPQAVRR